MNLFSLLHFLLALLLAPLFLGVVDRTKAVVAGRAGRPLLQRYSDLAKLLGKGAAVSRTTTWVFFGGPALALAAVLLALLLLPLGGVPALVAFPGDFILFAGFLALARFAMVSAALDTGSAFEGMGSAREAFFSALGEPMLILAFAALTRLTGSLSLSGMFPALSPGTWTREAPALLLLGGAFLILALSENSRVPVDDPNTHLELTMIHEAMVLDHSGPDFAFITYGSFLKLWAMGALTMGVLLPPLGGNPWVNGLIFLLGMNALGVTVGLVESATARLRLPRVPQLLIGAGALSGLALILVSR